MARKFPGANVNTFTGTDQIHYEIQRLEAVNTWKTIKYGPENRLK